MAPSSGHNPWAALDPTRLRRILRLGTPIARFVETRKPLLGIADPPLRDRTGGASNCASNRPARHAVRSQKHDPSPLPQTPPRARQTIEIGALLHRQNAKCRFRDADHASLNHDSFISDSGYYSLMSSPSRAVESAAVADLSIEAKKIVVAGDYVTVHMEFKGHVTGRFCHTRQARATRLLPVALLPPVASVRAPQIRPPLGKVATTQLRWPPGKAEAWGLLAESRSSVQ